uniref:Uncharacterized protein n=1 Tax=Gadus morhua TaxID=8049 RepID=A0A8C5D1R3_GADMO
CVCGEGKGGDRDPGGKSLTRPGRGQLRGPPPRAEASPRYQQPTVASVSRALSPYTHRRMCELSEDAQARLAHLQLGPHHFRKQTLSQPPFQVGGSPLAAPPPPPPDGGCKEREIDGWTDGDMDKRTDRWIDKQINGRQTDGWMDGPRREESICRRCLCPLNFIWYSSLIV